MSSHNNHNNNNETAVNNNNNNGGGYQSPRTALQHELVAFSYEVVDLVLNIYDNRLEEIKDIFQQKGGQLGPVEFTEAILQLLGPNAEVKIRVPPSYANANVNVNAKGGGGPGGRRATTASVEEDDTPWGDETGTTRMSSRAGGSRQAGRSLRSGSASSSTRTRTRGGESDQKGGESTVPQFQRQVLDEETLRYRLMALFEELDVTKAGVVTWNQYATFCMHLSEVVVDPQFIHSLEEYQKYNPEEEGVEEEWVESESSSDNEEPATKQARLTRRLQQIFNNSTSNVSESLSSNDFSHIVEKNINQTMNDPNKKQEKKRLQRKMASQNAESKSSSQKRVRSAIELIQYIPVIDAVAKVEAKGSGVQLLKADNLAHLGTLKDSTGSKGTKSDCNVVEAIEWFASSHSFSKPYMLTASANSTITLWDIQLGNRMGTKITSWPTGSSQQCMKFIDRYSILYSGSSLGSLHSWNIRDACEVSSARLHDDIITKIVDIPAQDALATSSHDKTAKVFDLVTSSEVLKFTGHRRGIVDIDYHDLYRVVLTGSYDHECGVYSPLTPKRLHTLAGHEMPLLAARGIPNSSEVLTASIDGKVKVWDLRQPNKPVYNMNITEDEVTGQSNKASKSYLRSFDICHPVRPQFMCAFKDIYLYRKIESKEMKHKAHSNAITGIGYDAKHGSILTSSGCSVYTWSILTGKLQREFRDIAKSSISCMLVDSTSGLFYIGTEFGSIQLHGTLTGHMLHRLSGHNAEVVALAFYQTDVISVGKDRQVLHHYTENALHSRESPKAMTVSRGSKAPGESSNAKFQESQELQGSHFSAAGPGREALPRSKNHQTALKGGITGTQSASDTQDVRLAGHSDDITCLDCYSRGGLIVTGGKDRLIYVWQAATGHVIAKEMLDSPISRVRFLRDESILATADEGGAVVLWKLQSTSSSLSPIAAFHHNPTSFQQGMTSDEIESLLDASRQQQTSQKSRNRPVSTPTQSSPAGSDSSRWKMQNAGSGRVSAFDESSDSEASGEFNQPPVVSSILYDPSECKLFTGDDEGHICCWNLRYLLQAYEVFEIGENASFGGSRKIQRRHSLDMETGHRDSVLRFTHKAKSLTELLPEIQFLNQAYNKRKQLWLSMQADIPNHLDSPVVSGPAHVTLDWQVSAHSEAAQVMTFVSSPGVPQTIISGGFDGHVVGTLISEGTLAGKLVGVVNESRNPSWELDIDTEVLRNHLTLADAGFEKPSKFGYDIQQVEGESSEHEDEASVSSSETPRVNRLRQKTPEAPIDPALRFSQQELCPPETKQRVTSALEQMHEMLDSAQISNIKKK